MKAAGSGSKIICLIQARVNSTRLPGKALKEVVGRTLTEHVIRRVKRSCLINSVVLLTGDQKSNTPLQSIADKNQILFFVGSEEDVLDRFYRAVVHLSLQDAKAIVRITADCPLIDPEVIDSVILTFLDHPMDYASNVNPRTFPKGMDVEVFSFSALEKSWQCAKQSDEREHVTVFMRESGLFATGNTLHQEDLSGERWAVDYPEDFELIKNIFNYFQNKNEEFKLKDILEYRKKNPQIFEVNAHLH